MGDDDHESVAGQHIDVGHVSDDGGGSEWMRHLSCTFLFQDQSCDVE